MVGDFLDGDLQELFVSPVISSFKVLRREEGENDGYIRVKCTLANADVLEFAEYVRVLKNKMSIETYSFHWQSAEGQMVRRWDNVEHHKEIDTFPHHVHFPDGTVGSSIPMDLQKVLAKIEEILRVDR
ncbi:MAG: hypothetical protein HGA78_10580 [Nitrospirales bacterium]|nr:hypothetical protein [Nitrospirales bacterium]